MRLNLNIFRKTIANLVIITVIITIFAVSISGTAALTGTANAPIYKGSSKDKVSLMVNVYWGTEYLDTMLQIFEDNGVRTTFFVGGTWASKNHDMLKKISEAGHEIGNHGYFHKDHAKLNEAGNRSEITATHNLVKALLNIDMKLFAPPSGSFDKTVLDAAAELGYTTVMWTRDTIDWRDKDSKLIFNRAVKNASGGDLVLMHPTAATAAALDSIIKELKSRGLTVSTVSDVLSAAVSS